MTAIKKGTKEYTQASIALFFAGFVTFANLYTTQPLFPEFSKTFDVSAVSASLTLSLTTGILAVSMLFAAPLSDVIGKKRLMVVSMFLASVLGLLTASSPSFTFLLIFRALLGIFVAGVPSIAMAYVGEQFSLDGIGKIMGLYIAGTSIGGMAGRIFTGILTDWFSWRIALAVIGILAFVLSIIFWYILPEPQKWIQKNMNLNQALAAYKFHLRNKQLLAIIGLAFLLMGSFVTLYNYVGYLLEAPPYFLSQAAIGSIFIVYLAGTFSSVFMGKQADKYGNKKMLLVSVGITGIGAVLTLLPSLIAIIGGLIIFTFGFFASHSIASAWVGEFARKNKAQASSLYLLFYYLGSSFIGFFGGYFWQLFEWFGVILLILILLLIGVPLILFAGRSTVSKAKKADQTSNISF